MHLLLEGPAFDPCHDYIMDRVMDRVQGAAIRTVDRERQCKAAHSGSVFRQSKSSMTCAGTRIDWGKDHGAAGIFRAPGEKNESNRSNLDDGSCGIHKLHADIDGRAIRARDFSSFRVESHGLAVQFEGLQFISHPESSRITTGSALLTFSS